MWFTALTKQEEKSVQQDTKGKDGSVQTADFEEVSMCTACVEEEQVAREVIPQQRTKEAARTADNEITVSDDNQQAKKEENAKNIVSDEEEIVDNASHTSSEEKETNSVLNEVDNLDRSSESVTEQQAIEENVEEATEDDTILDAKQSDEDKEADGVLNANETKETPEDAEEDQIPEAKDVSSKMYQLIFI